MPVIKCPVDGCDYSTPDQEAVIGAALLNSHQTHRTAQGRFHQRAPLSTGYTSNLGGESHQVGRTRQSHPVAGVLR